MYDCHAEFYYDCGDSYYYESNDCYVDLCYDDCPNPGTCRTDDLKKLGWVAFALIVLVICIICCTRKKRQKMRQRENEARIRNLEQANIYQAQE